VRLDLPFDGLHGGGWCGTTFTDIALVCDQGGGVDWVIRPAPGPGRSCGLGHLGCLETWGLEVKEWLRDGRLFTRPGVGERRLGALQRGGRLDDPPALGQARVA
jgi:hypothetical protein